MRDSSRVRTSSLGQLVFCADTGKGAWKTLVDKELPVVDLTNSGRGEAGQ